MTSIYDASTTAASNTTVGGININTGWPPSNVGPATREIIAETKGALVGITASGTDTYTATMTPTPSALVDGMSVAVRFTNSNLTTTPTLNLNSLGAKTIKKDGGSALAVGDIPAGHEAVLRYRTSDTSWILMNPKLSTSGLVTTSTTITAGTGLSGGGDLSTNRTVAFAPSGLSTVTVATNDLVVVSDTSNSGAPALVSASGLPGTFTAGTSLVMNPYANNTTTTQAHGLGVKPTFFTITLECLTADLNYSVGDKIDLPLASFTTNPGNAYGVYSDATNTNLITSASFTPTILDKSTRASSAITVAKWKITVTPYKLN